MPGKSKDFVVALMAGIIVFSVFALKNSKFLYKLRPETFSEALAENFDSSKNVKPGRVEAFSNLHRVQVDLPLHVKYYSKTDTLVSVFDTLGIQVGKTLSFKQMHDEDQNRVRQILNFAK